ncbi:hypothetical protein R6Q57_017542 [Mikania cordata]
MNATLGLFDYILAGDGGGGGMPSGGSTAALAGSKEDNKNTMVICNDVTSSYPFVDGNLDDLELGLGLGIGSGGLKSNTVATGGWSQHARILTAKDFPISLVSKPNSSSSSSVNVPDLLVSGSKRTTIDSVSPSNGTSVVGWPPVSKAHRISSLANQIKSPTENFTSKPEQNKSKNQMIRIKDYLDEKNGISNKKYQSVKVNMDGTLDLWWGEKLISMLIHHMRWLSSEAIKPLRLLDGTSEFVLTYEDKDGDCMLVGDVPWLTFLGSVKKLRIMNNSDCNELGE